MKSLLGILLGVSMALPAAALGDDQVGADELAQRLRVKIRTVQHMALNPLLVGAVREQNQEGLDLNEIKTRDEEWKNADGLTRRMRELMSTPAARLLRDTVADGSTFTEAFLTDDQGANVAVFPPTSDYWQGDEEKWTASWAGGEGAVFIGPLEHDSSTNKFAVQVSAPVKDGAKTIGVLVVGVSVDYVETHE